MYSGIVGRIQGYLLGSIVNIIGDERGGERKAAVQEQNDREIK